LQVGAANSCLAFSTPATWCRIFMSRKFMSRIFSVTIMYGILLRQLFFVVTVVYNGHGIFYMADVNSFLLVN